MKKSLIEKMHCIFCRGPFECHSFIDFSPEVVEKGVLVCGGCRAWFPIEDRVLELLPANLAYGEDRSRFWSSHESALRALGLAAELPAEGSAVAEQKIQQDHFDAYAQSQTQTYYDYQNMPFWKCVDKEVFGAWRRSIAAGKTLLEIGCGQGRGLAQLADLPIEVAAFDISKQMVREGAARYHAKPSQADVSFFVADASRLPFLSETFDYVLAYGVLHHLPDPGQTCKEIARVLTPHGVYFGSENNESGLRVFFDWLQKVLPIWDEEAGEEPLLSERKLSAWFSQTGCTPRTTTHVFVPPHLVNWLGGEWGGKLVQLTDDFATSLPLTRRHGGLITFSVEKEGASA